MSLPENSARVMKKRKKGNSRRGVPFSRAYARALTTKALISKQMLTEKRDIDDCLSPLVRWSGMAVYNWGGRALRGYSPGRRHRYSRLAEARGTGPGGIRWELPGWG